MNPSARLVVVLSLAVTACTERIQVLAGTAPAEPASSNAAIVADALSGGQTHTCSAAGGVLCWGDASRGDLGLGDIPEGGLVESPAMVSGATGVVAVSAGQNFTCALDGMGNVSCWGANDHGELGVGDTMDRDAPAAVSLPASATQISSDFWFACALLSDRSLWCWGANREGEIGQGDAFPGADALSPTRVGTATFSNVSTGEGQACAVQTDGSLYCWGRNTEGELGLGLGVGVQIRVPTRVGTDADWEAISAGQSNTCALKTDGTLWCWGDNSSGELGLGDNQERDTPTEVGTGGGYTLVSVNTFGGCALKTGALYCWGRNAEGQLGTGDTTDRLSPTQIGTDTDWKTVASGRFHTCAAKTDRSVWCTGANDSGQLGTGDLARRNSFTKVRE